jgi:RNA polymerase sigma-70 factor (ECF subfamily)
MHDRTEDQALVARIIDGDRVALELLYRRHAHWLTARLQSRCGDPDLADLAVQDTFLAVWKSAKKYRNAGEVGAWIWGIGIRRLIDHLRKRKATPVDPGIIGATVGVAPVHDQISHSSEDAALARSEFGVAHQALDQLDPELRAVLVATAIDGLSTKEAAALLGIPQGTVKTRLMRARHQMQEVLT